MSCIDSSTPSLQKMGAQPSTEADADGDEEDIFPSIKRGHSSYLVSVLQSHFVDGWGRLVGRM